MKRDPYLLGTCNPYWFSRTVWQMMFFQCQRVVTKRRGEGPDDGTALRHRYRQKRTARLIAAAKRGGDTQASRNGVVVTSRGSRSAQRITNTERSEDVAQEHFSQSFSFISSVFKRKGAVFRLGSTRIAMNEALMGCVEGGDLEVLPERDGDV